MDDISKLSSHKYIANKYFPSRVCFDCAKVDRHVQRVPIKPNRTNILVITPLTKNGNNWKLCMGQ